MAKAATQRRAKPRRAAPAARRTAKSARSAVSAAKPAPSKPVRKLAGFAARKVLKSTLRAAARSGASVIRTVADRTAEVGKEALDSGLNRRLPIQLSLDVAVPIGIAWDEWMRFRSFTEGVHRIEGVERDGDRLVGATAGRLSSDWEAEIVDERENQSFAWRSIEGSDCAGLVTFHQLSDRLTRIELDLDVLPTNPAEALSLAAHLAHRRAEAELRRFKAAVEFINPDVYQAELASNGDGPENESNQ